MEIDRTHMCYTQMAILAERLSKKDISLTYLHFTQFISTDRHQYTDGLQIQNSLYRSTAS